MLKVLSSLHSGYEALKSAGNFNETLLDPVNGHSYEPNSASFVKTFGHTLFDHFSLVSNFNYLYF